MLDWKIRKGATDGQKVLHTGADSQQAEGSRDSAQPGYCPTCSLEENPRPRGVQKLSGREEYRLRVGDYRILYVIDDGNHTVTIVAVGHRHEVYG